MIGKAMKDTPAVPPDNYSAAERALWSLKFQAAIESALPFVAGQLEYWRRRQALREKRTDIE